MAKGLADAVASGMVWMDNPDMVERFAQKTPLKAAGPQIFYAGGEQRATGK